MHKIRLQLPDRRSERSTGLLERIARRAYVVLLLRMWVSANSEFLRHLHGWSHHVLYRRRGINWLSLLYLLLMDACRWRRQGLRSWLRNRGIEEVGAREVAIGHPILLRGGRK